MHAHACAHLSWLGTVTTPRMPWLQAATMQHGPLPGAVHSSPSQPPSVQLPTFLRAPSTTRYSAFLGSVWMVMMQPQ